MKRVISLAVAAAAMLLWTGAIARAQNPTCSSGDAYCVATDNATEGNGNPLEPLTSKLPYQGIFAVGPKMQGSTPDFYLFVDGNETLLDPFAGYLGLSAADANHAALALVGDREGNFTRGGPNRSLVDLLQSYGPIVPPSLMQTPTDLSHLAPNLSMSPGTPFPPPFPDFSHTLDTPLAVYIGYLKH